MGGWTDNQNFRIKFKRRDSFGYEYTLFAAASTTITRAGIVAYQASNGTVTVHAKLTAGQYGKVTYTITDSYQATIVDNPSLTTSTPAGTLVFDSTNVSSYPPAMKFPDNQKLEFGAGGDLRIYHDSSNSIIEDNGTGQLQLKGTVNINNAYTLPTSDGSANQVLQTNGSGTLSFATVSGGTAADDITAGDAAVNLTTTSGNITIDAQGSNTDIIFKGTDGSTDITALTLDMSNLGQANFNAGIRSSSSWFWSGADDIDALLFGVDADIRVTHVHNTGLLLKAQSLSDVELQLENSTCKVKAADQGNGNKKIQLQGGGVDIISTANENITIDAQGGDTDIIFKGTDNTTDITFLTLDGSDRGVLIPGSGSETSHRLQVGSKIAMFDDGNAHLHSLGGTFWINANQAASVRINNQQNGDVILTNGTGKVGIGTDAPSSPLHVVGNVEVQGHVLPTADDTYDLGSSSKQWRDIYTGDINLNNTKTRDNEVDGTRGSWTIQEGADDLFLINRVSGKKYKFKLEEIK
jgi:hypothetical protein